MSGCQASGDDTKSTSTQLLSISVWTQPLHIDTVNTEMSRFISQMLFYEKRPLILAA